MAVLKGVIPWWSLPLNWVIGGFQPQALSVKGFDGLTESSTATPSYLRQPRWESFLCCDPREMYVINIIEYSLRLK